LSTELELKEKQVCELKQEIKSHVDKIKATSLEHEALMKIRIEEIETKNKLLQDLDKNCQK
jgi:hypothetical protein